MEDNGLEPMTFWLPARFLPYWRSLTVIPIYWQNKDLR